MAVTPGSLMQEIADFSLLFPALPLTDYDFTGDLEFLQECTSHYPYAEEMYDLCGREGIVVIDETPAVGINAGGSQNPYEVMRIRGHHEDVIRDMISRDKSHPCVVMWSIANEPDTEHFPQSAFDYFHPLYQLAHSCDPQDRPVTFVRGQNDYTRDIITRAMDVCCINRYYG